MELLYDLYVVGSPMSPHMSAVFISELVFGSWFSCICLHAELYHGIVGVGIGGLEYYHAGVAMTTDSAEYLQTTWRRSIAAVLRVVKLT